TPWLALAGLRGYERVTRFTGVGKTVGAHTLTIVVYGDYDDSTPLGTFTVTPGALWDWQLHYSKKLSAVKVVLTESSAGAGPAMTAVEIEYAIRSSHRPSPASKRAA